MYDRARELLERNGYRGVPVSGEECFLVGDTGLAIEALSAAVEDGRPFTVTCLSTIWERLASYGSHQFEKPCQVGAVLAGHAGVEICFPAAKDEGGA